MTIDSNATDRPLAGACACGAVRYEVADAFLYAANCHCSRCRAATGTAFKAFAGIERTKLAITTGDDTLLIVGEENANDTRCGVCGSLLFSELPRKTQAVRSASMVAVGRSLRHRS